MNRKEREVGVKGGIPEERVAATADSKLDFRDEVLGKIFNAAEIVREEGNSCGVEINV